MTDDLHLNNKSTVALNAHLSLRVGMNLNFFCAGKKTASTHSSYSPLPENPKQKMTALVSLVKRYRSRIFLSCSASTLRSHNLPWPTLKRIKDVSPALDYSVVSKVSCEGKHMGSNTLRVQEESIAHFRDGIQSMHLL